MSIDICQFCNIKYDQDFHAEHEEECESNPANREECEYCGGLDGEHEDITTMESVYPGEPHQAPTGSQRCPNSLPDNDDYDDQE